jgi:hypothetical protein
MTLTVPDTKLAKVRYEARRIIKRPDSLTARKLASFIGLATSLSPAILPGRVFLRFLQRDLASSVKHARYNWNRANPALSPESLEELSWWESSVHLHNGAPIVPPSPKAILTTDASETGWGSTFHGQTCSGYWTPEEASQSSNWRELKAVSIAIRLAAPHAVGLPFLIRSDNTTTLANIRKGGGAKSLPLVLLAKDVWNTALEFGLQLQVQFIPGLVNIDADKASRLLNFRDEYYLSDRAMAMIHARYGRLNVDLFASRINHRLPRYVSWNPDPDALYQDAFSRPLPDFALAHPPIALIGQVLFRAMQEHPANLILVTPDWPTAAFTPLLVSVATDHLVIPYTDIVGPYHHRLSNLEVELIAWKL